MKALLVVLLVVVFGGCGVLSSDTDAGIAVDIEPTQAVFSLEENVKVWLTNRSADTVYVNFQSCPPMLQQRVGSRWETVRFDNIACTLELRVPTPVAPEAKFSTVVVSKFFYVDRPVEEGIYRVALQVGQDRRITDGSTVRIEETQFSEPFRLAEAE